MTYTSLKALEKIVQTKARAIQSFPRYAITDCGEVWSNFGDEWKRRRFSIAPYGHRRVILSKHSKQFSFYIHRLVLEAFVGPRPPGMQACHNDGNPSNNHKSNLRWDTPKGNNADKKRHGTHPSGEKHPLARLTATQITDIRKQANTGVSIKYLSRKYKVTDGHISNIIHKTLWKHVHDGIDQSMKHYTRGERHPQSKLTKDDVQQIKHMIAQGIQQKTIAEHFSVSRALICTINKGKLWTHIP